MGKKIIITGGLGYIGTELCKIYSGFSWNDKIIVIDEGKIEEVSKKSYDLYLKQNNIQSGIKNYNESISLILKYKFQANE